MVFTQSRSIQAIGITSELNKLIMSILIFMETPNVLNVSCVIQNWFCGLHLQEIFFCIQEMMFALMIFTSRIICLPCFFFVSGSWEDPQECFAVECLLNTHPITCLSVTYID